MQALQIGCAKFQFSGESPLTMRDILAGNHRYTIGLSRFVITIQISVCRTALQSLPLMREVARRAGGREKVAVLSLPQSKIGSEEPFFASPLVRGGLYAL